MKKLQVTALILMLSASMAPITCFAEAENTAAEESAAEESVASSSELGPQNEISDEGLSAVTAKDVEEGTYSIEVECSSSMFPIDDCQLTVKDGKMSAVLTMGGQGYLKLYMGTGQEAAKASEDEFITFVENDEGKQTYEVPVEALDQAISCAAFSKRKQKWYDRTLIFKASSLPDGVQKNIRMTTLEDLGLADGEYLVEVEIEGGSGHTKIESPAPLTVKDGQAEATIVWGNSNYDYMKIKEEKYQWDGNGEHSTFVIPVTGFDYKMPVIADTVALGTPRELDYTLTFYSDTIVEAE